jgi:hypothetical protein
MSSLRLGERLFVLAFLAISLYGIAPLLRTMAH